MSKKKNKAVVKAIKDGVPYIARKDGEPVAIALPWDIWIALNERIADARHRASFEDRPEQPLGPSWPKARPVLVTDEMIADTGPSMLEHMQHHILDLYHQQVLADEHAVLDGAVPVVPPTDLPLASDLTGWYDTLHLAEDEKDDFTQWFQSKKDTDPEFPVSGQATQ